MRYRAVFRCIAGCPGEFPLDQPIYRCPTCGDLLEVVHDIEALQRAQAAGVDAALRRALQAHRPGPTARASGARRSGSAPDVRDENVVSMDEGGTNLFWAERYGRQLGLDDLWVKQCGNSHTGSFKDLGMTVLVSVVRQMIADGQADPRGRLRVDRRHVGGARRLRGGGRHPARSCSCRAARSRPRSSCSRSPTARSCSRSTPTSTAAWPSCSGSPPRRASTSPTR